MGLAAEHCASRCNISREEQDQYAIEAYKRYLPEKRGLENLLEFGKVQFNLSGVVASDEGSLIPQYRKDVSELMTELLPQLMKALPDWPSIEAETAGPA